MVALPLEPDGVTASEVDVGRRQIIQALTAASMVVVLDEGTDLCLEITGQIAVLEKDAVLHRLVPAFDLAMRLRMAGCSTNVLDPPVKPVGEIRGDVARAIVGEQLRPALDASLSEPAALCAVPSGSLVGCRVPHSESSPAAIMLFFE